MIRNRNSKEHEYFMASSRFRGNKNLAKREVANRKSRINLFYSLMQPLK
jgi:hypothetical protein